MDIRIDTQSFKYDQIFGGNMTIQAINTRNQFKGKIIEIVTGPVVSEVVVGTPFGTVTSVITTRSINELELSVGSDVVALVKSTEVSLAKL
jgi:molybdopterin-binding protein